MRSLSLTLFVAAMCIAGPGLAQAPDADALTGAPLARAGLVLEGADVPYAVRAEAFLGGLAALHASDATEDTTAIPSLLRSFGLEPSSAAAQSLVDLAVGLERDHPKVSDTARAQAKSGRGLDLEQAGGWLDQRYAKAGASFGLWLRQRQAEGLAIEPLLDRLLNNGALGVTMFTDDSPAALTTRLKRQSGIFNQHLTTELGHLPRRFEQ